ncbi:MAG: transcription termination factor Rho [Verrucomicrobiae bacterium]|nr:transcription termination factor Rho [Verrucomicrobiae bacterium]
MPAKPSPTPAPVSAPAPRKEYPKTRGILELSDKGFGFLRQESKNYQPSKDDVFVNPNVVRELQLREGLLLEGDMVPTPRGGFEILNISKISDQKVEDYRKSQLFNSLTVIDPIEPLHLETDAAIISTRCLDLFCPVGKGTRGLIVAPPRSGKTILLKEIANGIAKNHPEVDLMTLLVDERPEEVTDFQRSTKGQIFASSNDEDLKSHVRLPRLVIEIAKRRVELGRDVVILMDSLTRMARAFNNYGRNSGRTMSGGLDSRAMEIPRKIFASARNTEEGGSLTILATILVDTGSRMDELIFQEFKGTGNMELVLDRNMAERRIFPAIDLYKSGTRKEEKLLPTDVLNKVHLLRRELAGRNPIEATESIVRAMQKTKTNSDLLTMIAKV